MRFKQVACQTYVAPLPQFPDWHIKWMCLIVMYFFIPKAQCSR